jgi:dihydrolipoamide dehydrogenase
VEADEEGISIVSDFRTIKTELAVIGGGAAGIEAAKRAVSHGMNVVLVDERKHLGGTCVNEGCIPAKVLGNVTRAIMTARDVAEVGLKLGKPEIDIEALRSYKESVVRGLSDGAKKGLEKSGVEIISGCARFESEGAISIKAAEVRIEFDKAIIATGSKIGQFPDWHVPGMWSTGKALALSGIPESLLVIGTTFYALELGMFYAIAGSKVTILEEGPKILEHADRDLVSIMMRKYSTVFDEVMTDTRIVSAEKDGDVFRITLEKDGETSTHEYGAVLIGYGRRPNTRGLQLENAGLNVDEKGRIGVDEQCRTSVEGIFAVGDVIEGPMMSHFAMHTGTVAADVCAGKEAVINRKTIPGFAYTDPQVVWVGLTETVAKEAGTKYIMGKAHLAGNARAHTEPNIHGMVKILADPQSRKVLGMGMTGPGAAEIISEGTLAVDSGLTVEQVAGIIRLHPTFSESVADAARDASAKCDKAGSD